MYRVKLILISVQLILFLQVHEQNTTLKAEVSRLKSSKKQLSSELSKLKDKYESLSQDFEKMPFIDEAEQAMDQLEEILIEMKSKFTKSPKHKVYLLCFGHPYCILSVYIHIYVHIFSIQPTYLRTCTIKFKG